jgi:alpha-aminoadipic semialdehyde synthase
MGHIIAIRREDKNEWERRVPLTPDHVRELREQHGIHTIVQPSPIRVFTDEEYRAAGAEIREDMCPSGLVIAVKEVPTELFEPGKTYIFFSHTIKGQAHNMPMLRRMMTLGNNLVDYERILDEHGRRLIFFGRYAGLAGMVETLHAYGRKLSLAGVDTPLATIRQAYEYASVEEVKADLGSVSARISLDGLPRELCPFVVGFAGYGNVSQGAQEIFDQLPVQEIPAARLREAPDSLEPDPHTLYKVVFREEDMVVPRTGEFELQDYYENPGKYRGMFDQYLPWLEILVNCIYWTPDYPRLVTKDYLRGRAGHRLKVIGDISCDIDGSVEITRRATMPDHACFTYHPASDNFTDDIAADGVTVMAVDNLPCEFPREASEDFSAVLKEYIPELVSTDFTRKLEEIRLHDYIKKALILHQGKLTPDYEYMEEFIT